MQIDLINDLHTYIKSTPIAQRLHDWEEICNDFKVDIDEFMIDTVECDNWTRCTDDDYPIDDSATVIAFYVESDEKWQYWIMRDCPYGWNVLCRNTAYWKYLNNPIKI